MDVRGKVLLTLALAKRSGIHTPDGIQVTARKEDGAYVIEGTKLFIPDAHIANYVDMLTYVDSSRFITCQAAWMLSEGIPCRREVSIAKAWVSEAFRKVTALAHQINGAIAYTDDHDLYLYSKRAKAWELLFGGADYHLNRVAKEMGL